MENYKGGCLCGSVRFELNEPPIWISACHCGTCRKRTGSDYGVSVVVDQSGVKEFTGRTKTHTRTGDSGKDVIYEFCPECGATVRWHIMLAPGRQAFAAGAFDDMSWMAILGEMYTAEAAPWGPLGCDAARPGPPDDDWRAALIEKTKMALGGAP
ncbi:MAG: GFA family protein [Rhodospirillales bacterium]|jgi:hypothetical protein|nr:aldehyde-activating protein [Rhodospirillaceae bacterium]MDP6428240.1 GFA family protein [Rhodospirillales bacterium]MDP6646038.1 GFA family protein [Rhodospirillales bacterium]MDP6842797.1 GFA family protein [Rhodospirillales bacterium]|tara:strand:+ start:83 stop:547 length:465 start_codon:yes stop_codon:yes gene_type:complete